MDGLGGKGKRVNIEEALRWVDVNCTDAATLDRVRSRRVARTLADEIDRLREELTTVMAQRIEWRCVAGGEIFTTDDTKVADTWRDDGFDVTKHVLTPNAEVRGA